MNKGIGVISHTALLFGSISELFFPCCPIYYYRCLANVNNSLVFCYIHITSLCSGKKEAGTSEQ